MNDLLFIIVLLMTAIVPITFFIGLFFLIFGRIKNQTDEEFANRIINIGFKFFLFAVACFLIGWICYTNLDIY